MACSQSVLAYGDELMPNSSIATSSSSSKDRQSLYFDAEAEVLLCTIRYLCAMDRTGRHFRGVHHHRIRKIDYSVTTPKGSLQGVHMCLFQWIIYKLSGI